MKYFVEIKGLTGWYYKTMKDAEKAAEDAKKIYGKLVKVTAVKR